jgi:hypothetical protein
MDRMLKVAVLPYLEMLVVSMAKSRKIWEKLEKS